eukprot:3764195-Amphidinium_carterae.1
MQLSSTRKIAWNGFGLNWSLQAWAALLSAQDSLMSHPKCRQHSQSRLAFFILGDTISSLQASRLVMAPAY